MDPRLPRIAALCAAVLMAADLASSHAQQTAAAAGAIPRLADGRPDMTGVWTPMGFVGGSDGLAELESLYTAAARAEMQRLSDADDPLYRCLPYGVPRSTLSSPWPFQIVQRPGTMVVLTEYYHAFRLIPTDGSPHAPDLLPSYFGDSVGRWDGDTLVVDVVGFNDKTWLADARDKPTATSRGIWLHSDALHVVERWRLADRETLEYQATVEDPTMLTRPWKSPTLTMKRQAIGKIGEGMCFDTTTYDLLRPSDQAPGK